MAIFKKTSSVNFPKTNIEAFLHHAPCHAQSPVALFAAGSKEAITSARNCASQLLNKGGRRSKHSSSLTVLAGKRNEEVFQLPTAFWTQMLWWSFGLLFFWCWFIGWRPRHQHQVGCFAWLRSCCHRCHPFEASQVPRLKVGVGLLHRANLTMKQQPKNDMEWPSRKQRWS